MNEAAAEIKKLVEKIKQLTEENEQLSGAEPTEPTSEAPSDGLLACYPDTEFKNLTRSTVALLAYWREQDFRLRYLAEHLDAPDLVDAVVTPEFPTASSSGKASFTDLLVESAKTAVAIEGKRSEGRYPTIGTWCDSDNKRRVLKHWCSLIRKRAALPADAQLEPLIYQMLHRTASACARPAEHAIVLYQMFGSDHVAEYEADLCALVSVLDPGPTLEVWMHVVTTEETAEYTTIAHELRQRIAADRPAIIRRALADGALFRFADIPPRRIAAG